MSDVAIQKSAEREFSVYVKPARMSIRHIADYLDGSERTVWDLIAKGELEVVGTPRKRWVITASADAYLARQPRQTLTRK
jgi:hypothetical protein